MSRSEAEVIALRLKNAFNRFSLAAYPSYFAGIPREVLTAFLQANRRAELIREELVYSRYTSRLWSAASQ